MDRFFLCLYEQYYIPSRDVPIFFFCPSLFPVSPWTSTLSLSPASRSSLRGPDRRCVRHDILSGLLTVFSILLSLVNLLFFFRFPGLVQPPESVPIDFVRDNKTHLARNILTNPCGDRAARRSEPVHVDRVTTENKPPCESPRRFEPENGLTRLHRRTQYCRGFDASPFLAIAGAASRRLLQETTRKVCFVRWIA